MENNYYQQPQQAYQPQQPQQPQQQVVNSSYEEASKQFLTKAIVSCCICFLPVGSIIAIFMAKKNRELLLDYLTRGGYHTVKIKVSSILSRAATYGGIGYTIFWAIYILYFAIMIGVAIIGAIAASRY
ncbi:MAG: hypothetical protein MJ098_04160 [Saccharofermentans sp.]|nr:hypothetical protein [Saccharofermentans sp.]